MVVYQQKKRASDHWSSQRLEVNDTEAGTLAFDASSGEYCAELDKIEVAELVEKLQKWMAAPTGTEEKR